MNHFFAGFEKKAVDEYKTNLSNYSKALDRKRKEEGLKRKEARKEGKKEFKQRTENIEKFEEKDNRPNLVYEGDSVVGGKKLDKEREKQDGQVQGLLDRGTRKDEKEKLQAGMGEQMPDQAPNQTQLRAGKAQEIPTPDVAQEAEETPKNNLAEKPDPGKELDKKASEVEEVAVIGVIKDGKILMGKRRDNGKWTNPGGHLEDGESPIQGAIRELKEETNIEAHPHQLRHLESKIISKGKKKLRIHAYKLDLGEYTQTSMKQDPDGEVFRWHWVNASGNNNENIYQNLHVPAGDNVLLNALGMVEQKTASFYDHYQMLWS